ncbi:MAG TPA: M48 family metalloprotease [Candidatus Baltobacteraceae bacterium]|nr:M48 family metalloprotease [Candidatus Baltobacteraceae bacterium]
MNAIRATIILLALIAAAFVPAASSAQSDEEAQMGADTFSDLKSQGVIVKSSPLYDTLRPIAADITRVVQPQYGYPIHFYIVHSNEPNAFAAPGGNVYVIDSLMYFVHNREELAGTLCHETSHLLHHDSLKEANHDEAIRRREILAQILLGPSLGTALATDAIGDLDSMHYSREAEESADLTGADNCAKAGLNPWGLVWLFQEFDSSNMKTPPEFLSDHPGNANRVEALEKHFSENPALFGRFDSDPKHGTRLNLPKNAAEEFLK